MTQPTIPTPEQDIEIVGQAILGANLPGASNAQVLAVLQSWQRIVERRRPQPVTAAQPPDAVEKTA